MPRIGERLIASAKQAREMVRAMNKPDPTMPEEMPEAVGDALYRLSTSGGGGTWADAYAVIRKMLMKGKG